MRAAGCRLWPVKASVKAHIQCTRSNTCPTLIRCDLMQRFTYLSWTESRHYCNGNHVCKMQLLDDGYTTQQQLHTTDGWIDWINALNWHWSLRPYIGLGGGNTAVRMSVKQTLHVPCVSSRCGSDLKVLFMFLGLFLSNVCAVLWVTTSTVFCVFVKKKFEGI